MPPWGSSIRSRIVFNNGHAEHWLNGVKVVEYDLDTDRFRMLLRASKYRNIPGFSDVRKGHIVLQDHTDAVWYRNIKMREIEP